ncbi:PBP1A family penicillin-binding protein [Brevibacillus dissolubilis]|uniref:PBP1A family penicillin-binding protein n=1 Tax=Brevibacillus dissolubilis TaxID=1844116 RepID=UPI0011176C23|nr:PBP1A family penicillin-binding protein [Brevibacillus dissolubilis]
MATAKRKVKKKNTILMFVIAFVFFLLFCVVGGYFMLLYSGEQMIDLQKLEDMKLEATEVYDKDSKLIGTLFQEEKREYVERKDIPQQLVDAFIAVEDKRFFEHNGVDIVRIMGAVWKDIRQGDLAEGGSTITQQLARNVYLNNDKDFFRKTKEMMIAVSLERKYTKDQIMEMYLNKVYLGEGMFGVKSASKYYFKKDDLKNLTLAEMASLAAIPKAPSTYAPFGKRDKAKERRDTILRLMMEQGFITEEQKLQAQAEPLPPEGNDTNVRRYKQGDQAFVDYVVEEAESRYMITEEMLYKGGFKIYTTMDRKMQDAMAKAFANAKNFPKNGPKQQVEAGMVVIDPKNGGIAGIMGGRNYVVKGFSHATHIQRQPGSSFKPLAVYAPAIDTNPGKWSMYASLNNQKQSFNGYEPNNWSGRYSESISMYKAVINSDNVPAVWLLNEIGVKTSQKYLKDFGIELSPEDNNLAIALGGLSKGTSPLKMAQAYSAFANEGKVTEAHVISKIVDTRTDETFEKTADVTQVITADTAWEVHKMLRGVVKEGTGKSARMKDGRPVAGKTGSTQATGKNNKDAWFVGYTPEYVGAVWMGFDRPDKQHELRPQDGSNIPAKLFATIMAEALKGQPVTDFKRPGGVEEEEKKPEAELSAPSLSAQLTMENNEQKVILNWASSNQNATYDLYRYIQSPDQKEKILSGSTATTYVDSVSDGVLYKYLVIPVIDGVEGPASNVAEVDISQLEQIIQDGEEQEENGQPQEGEIPIDGEQGQNGDQNQNPDPSQPSGNGNGNNGNNGNGGQPSDPGTSSTDPNGNPQLPPPDIMPPSDQGGGGQPPATPDQSTTPTPSG